MWRTLKAAGDLVRITWETVRHGESVTLGLPRGCRPLSKESAPSEEAELAFAPDQSEVVASVTRHVLYEAAGSEAELDVWLRADQEGGAAEVMFGNRRIGIAVVASGLVSQLADMASRSVVADGALHVREPQGQARVEFTRLRVALPA